jgi:AraC-like DNA-binding protein
VLFIPALTADALLSGFRAIGLDAELLAKSSGLDARDLQAPDAAVPLGVLEGLWGEVWRLAPREEIVSEVGLAIPFGAFGVLDYLAGSAETVEAAMIALRDHFRAVATGVALDLVPDAKGAWLRVVTTAPMSGREVAEELTVAINAGRFRALAESPEPIDAIELTRPAPAQPTRHAELFGAPVTFGHASGGMHVPKRALGARMKTSDPALRRTLGQVAKRLAIGADGIPELELAIRSRLRDLLGSSGVGSGAARVARSLGLSERSLHRKLSGIGRTYQQIVDDFRAAEAERLLADRVPFAQVALALGFADQTAFNRAFRRWKGATPSAWLAQRQAERAARR